MAVKAGDFNLALSAPKLRREARNIVETVSSALSHDLILTISGGVAMEIYTEGVLHEKAAK